MKAKQLLTILASAMFGAMAVLLVEHLSNPIPYEDALDEQLEIIWAQDQLLQLIYHNDPTYWYDVIMETDEYDNLNEARNGDWQDFYE